MSISGQWLVCVECYRIFPHFLCTNFSSLYVFRGWIWSENCRRTLSTRPFYYKHFRCLFSRSRLNYELLYSLYLVSFGRYSKSIHITVFIVSKKSILNDKFRFEHIFTFSLSNIVCVFFVFVANARIKLDLENRSHTCTKYLYTHSYILCIIFIFLFSPTNLYSVQGSLPNGDVVVCSRLMSAKEIFWFIACWFFHPLSFIFDCWKLRLNHYTRVRFLL